jgi:hypothetical protein
VTPLYSLDAGAQLSITDLSSLELWTVSLWTVVPLVREIKELISTDKWILGFGTGKAASLLLALVPSLGYN